MQIAFDTFKNPIESVTIQGEIGQIRINKPVVCTNFIKLIDKLEGIPKKVKRIYVVQVVDHTAAEHLLEYVSSAVERGTIITLVGLDKLKSNTLFENEFNDEFNTDYVAG